MTSEPYCIITKILYFYFISQITLNLQYSRVIDASHIVVTLKINANLRSLLDSGKSINQTSPINALDKKEGLFRRALQNTVSSILRILKLFIRQALLF